MTTIWIGKYENTEIEVENTWFSGERLFVNGKLQDKKYSLVSCDMTGHLITKQGERLNIKVNLSGSFTIQCTVFVDDEQIEMIKQ